MSGESCAVAHLSAARTQRAAFLSSKAREELTLIADDVSSPEARVEAAAKVLHPYDAEADGAAAGARSKPRILVMALRTRLQFKISSTLRRRVS